MTSTASKSFFDLATDPDFWRTLAARTGNADFTITENGRVKAEDPHKLTADAIDQALEELRDDGFFIVDGIMDGEAAKSMADLVQFLAQQRWPAIFAMVYDEFWTPFQRCSWILTRSLGAGYKLLPNFWIDYVPAAASGRGWRPHRSRSDCQTIRADGMPETLRVSIALTHATTYNGCLYLL